MMGALLALAIPVIALARYRTIKEECRNKG